MPQPTSLEITTVGAAGFELRSVERFRHKGPALLAHMFRGVAARA